MPVEISEEEFKALQDSAKRAEELESSKKRLEDENSKMKGRAQKAEGELDEAHKAKLAAEGKTQELLDIARADKVKVEDDFKALKASTLREKLRNEISIHAKDAHDIDSLLSIKSHKDLLKMDEASLTVDGAKEFVDACRESHKFMFEAKKFNSGDNTPPNGGKSDEEFKSEEDKYLSELRACSTRKAMDEVRKKYGKSVD